MWTSWSAAYRDVQIVDRENHRVAVYNLTEYDLGEPSNYEALRAMLIEAAEQ